MNTITIITHPEQIANESSILQTLFENGLERLHIRKPDYTPAQIQKYLDGIAPEYRWKTVVHQHHFLAVDYDCSGVHFSVEKRMATKPEIFAKHKADNFTISTSVHNVAEAASVSDAIDYSFIGPVFHSISKPGYSPKIDFSSLEFKQLLHTTALVAVGGISPETIDQALDYGFNSFALLGTIWNSHTPLQNFIACQKSVHLH
ncbi:thiamine phosphate synthase [Flavobacterium kingsejongi]|nr:thiamine phosphate synthase [Flavobacterium kingsejongi]